MFFDNFTDGFYVWKVRSLGYIYNFAFFGKNIDYFAFLNIGGIADRTFKKEIA